MKLISVTWSYENFSTYQESILYKSFIKHNSFNDFINIHFNRNYYKDMETQFKTRFDYQYEYILYKIVLLQNELNKLSLSDNIIYADTSDVVCLGDISLLDNYILESKVFFSSEINQYPSQKTWNIYSNKKNKLFLNSGLFFGSCYNILKLMNNSINNILSLEYKDFGGDQGVYTYNYIHYNDIELDENSNFLLSTYLRSPENYYYTNNRIFCKITNNSPLFIHDNGWNYGSPKFIERFNLA